MLALHTFTCPSSICPQCTLLSFPSSYVCRSLQVLMVVQSRRRTDLGSDGENILRHTVPLVRVQHLHPRPASRAVTQQLHVLHGSPKSSAVCDGAHQLYVSGKSIHSSCTRASFSVFSLRNGSIYLSLLFCFSLGAATVIPWMRSTLGTHRDCSCGLIERAWKTYEKTRSSHA